ILGVFLMIFLLLLVQIPLSISIGALFSGFSVVVRDFYEVHRPFLYTFIFCLAFFAFQSYDDFSKIDKYIVIVFIGLAILGLNQYLRVSDSVTDLYTKHHNAMTRRLSAPFINPYDYAYVM